MEIRQMNGKQYFICEKTESMLLDEVAVKMMEQNQMDGLLPFRYVQQENQRYFRYETGDGETLAEWLRRSQRRQDVIKLLESLIRTGGEVEGYLMEETGIYINPSFMMVRENQCMAVYIPVMGGVRGNLLELARQVISSVNYAFDDAFDYLFDLQNAFGRGDIHNLTDLKKWIRVVNGEEAAGMPEESFSGNMGSMPEAVIRPEPEQQNTLAEELKPVKKTATPGKKVKRDSFEGIFGDVGFESKKDKKEKKAGKEEKAAKKKKEKQGFFAKKKKQNCQEPESAMEIMEPSLAVRKPDTSGKEILNDLDYGDTTTVMGVRSVFVLTQTKGNVEYHLTGDSYIIGTSAQADIIVRNNPTVSRKHARLFRKQDSWYIEDTGSTNGTCVNGEILKKMEPYQLNNKARIQLSDEAYVFEIRR